MFLTLSQLSFLYNKFFLFITWSSAAYHKTGSVQNIYTEQNHLEHKIEQQTRKKSFINILFYIQFNLQQESIPCHYFTVCADK